MSVTPLASRSSAPAEVSAEFFAEGCSIDDEARARQRLEQGSEGGVAHPVVRPRHARAHGQRGIGVEQQETVEASTQLAACVGRGPRIVGERKAAAGEIALAVTRGAEALRLDRRIRCEPAIDRPS